MRFLTALVVLALTSQPAMADYAVWADGKEGLSLSYPDTWHQISNFQPDDLVTIIAPGNGQNATCRVKAREERRYMMYPVRLADAVQRVHLSEEFWREYLAQYENVNLQFVQDGASFGRAAGSFATASYAIKHPANGQTRSGILAAGINRDRLYILECSTSQESFMAMRPMFLSILKSVDMKKRVHELKQGDYADFRDYQIEYGAQNKKYFERH